MVYILFSPPLRVFAVAVFAVFVSVRRSAAALLWSCNCISVTRVAAASRAAVSSVMSGNGMSKSRGGVAVVGKYHPIEGITCAIVTALSNLPPVLGWVGGPHG